MVARLLTGSADNERSMDIDVLLWQQSLNRYSLNVIIRAGFVSAAGIVHVAY